MKRYTRDPATPSHLRTLVESARGDDLELRRRRRVAERLGILASPVAPGEPGSHPASSAKWVSAKGLALTAVALVGGASYVTFSSSRPPPQTSSFVAPMSPAAPLEIAPAKRDVAPSAPASNVAAMAIDALPDRPLDPPTARPVRALASAAETAKSGNDVARSGRGEFEGRSPSNANEANLLRLELASLDAVRRATEAGRPREALGLLDAYAAKFPSGKLRGEAVVLRIEALHASGERSRAAELARRLLRDSPNTPYAARVRAALESDSRE